MDNRLNFLIGLGLGAAAMYLLDPDRGRRRRSLVRDQVVHGAHEAEDFSSGMASRARHMRNRARGAIHEGRRRLMDDAVDDAILEARVRARLGHLVSDAGGIAVSSEHGRVTLRGTAPREEMEALVDGVQDVPGVHDVISRLSPTRILG